MLIRLSSLICAAVILALAGLPARAQGLDVTGWWWNASEAGRGFAIERQGDYLFLSTFVYDSAGRTSTWYISTAKMQSSAVYQGDLVAYSGGQAIGGSYRTAGGRTVGTARVTFTSSTRATLTWLGGTTALVRFPITATGLSAPRRSFQPETGWYWNPSEGGSGYFLEVQGDTLFMAGFLYRVDGTPVWYIANNAMLTDRVFQAPLAEYANGQPTGGSHRNATLLQTLGDVRLEFSTPSAGTMTFANYGRRIPLERFHFATLPSDPGAAGEATLTGIDRDQNGIRDEVDRRIAELAPASTIERDGLREVARALQAYLANRTTSQAAATFSRVEMARHCLDLLAPALAADAIDEITAETINTSARGQIFVEFLSRSAQSTTLPDVSLGNLTQCGFIQGLARVFGAADRGVAADRADVPVEGPRPALPPIASDRSSTASTCGGVSVLHINGVLTEASAAVGNTVTLKNVLRVYAPESAGWAFDQVHNPSGGAISDLWESFRQRAQSMTYRDFVRLFYNTSLGNAFFRVQTPAVQAAWVSAVGAAVAAARTSSIPAAELSRYTTRIRDNLTAGNFVILAPHSQGNLFANAAYRALTSAERQNVRIVSVADPDVAIADGSRSFTRDDDRVMAAVRAAVGAEAPTISAASIRPEPNGDISYDPVLNHGYGPAYLLINDIGEDVAARFRSVAGSRSATTVARNFALESGGQGTTGKTFKLGSNAGQVTITYDMYGIPDQLDVRYRGNVVASTRRLVSGSGTLSFRYTPVQNDQDVVVTVTAPTSGTAWEFRLSCPR